MQAASHDIWDQKYRLKRADGSPVDATPDHTWQRVARALADCEADPASRDRWYETFLSILRRGAIPAGRIVASAGAGALRPGASLINCTVSGAIGDTLNLILEQLHEAGLTLQAGCGIGYEFSTLRPAQAPVAGPATNSSGPIPFMALYDSMCGTIASAGDRRGAQMATFDVSHPDIEAFINAKQTADRLTNFNLSVLIPDAFLQAVDTDATWPLVFPLLKSERDRNPGPDDADLQWRYWPVPGDFMTDAAGRVACRIYRRVRARDLWQHIMRSTYDTAEPGFVLIDRVNDWNNNWFCEVVRATNPCGEQPLPPWGACLLGSVDLSRFVDQPFTAQARFDWPGFTQVVRVFTRMLDNVVDIGALPLPAQRREIVRKRRHGMGVLGLGTALAMLRIRYGCAAAVAFTSDICRHLAITGWEEGLKLAQEKGPAPIMAELFELTPELLRRRPELQADGFAAGDRVPGRILHARYSRYMQQLRREVPELIDALAGHGARFTHHSSIAPTGTISLALADNASSGIEPSFAHHYSRSVTRAGRRSRESLEVFSRELLLLREHTGNAAADLPDYFVTSTSVPPHEHVDMQAAAQRWVDSSISKTINVAADYPFAAFEDIYRYAHAQGLKGCTTFRYNPAVRQGVLIDTATLAATGYRFTRQSGASFELQGNDSLEYAGERQTAADLYAAIREGRYTGVAVADGIVRAEILAAPGTAANPAMAPASAPYKPDDALRQCSRCGARAVLWVDACSLCRNCGDSRCE